ncbi:hypothetical protein [Bradyrhizobium sp. Ghvi]|uniref:hypothetical protein n=1 Tax=Bradyrhizobium sp. Ghvi TaxID=1855319 RepID=UPI001177A2F9|nr:hypothetical protein [Bradyrhizobium sp. Ghvi]
MRINDTGNDATHRLAFLTLPQQCGKIRMELGNSEVAEASGVLTFVNEGAHATAERCFQRHEGAIARVPSEDPVY